MAEQPEQEEKKPGQPTIFNSDIGDDWGEAFEADIQVSPKAEATSDFFLPEVADEPTVGPSPAAGPKAVAEGEGRGLSQGLSARLRSLSLPRRLLFLGGPLLLVLALFFLFHHPPTKPPAQNAAPPTPPAAQRIVKAAGPTAASTLPPKAEASPPAQVASPSEPLGRRLILRKKWRFPALLIHAEGGKGQGPIIIANDLTLVLKLAPEVMPPTDKETLVRETLYQFYLNQPPDDLRRYALDRGALSSRLKAWVLKQWPGLPLDAITVDRYQIL